MPPPNYKFESGKGLHQIKKFKKKKKFHLSPNIKLNSSIFYLLLSFYHTPLPAYIIIIVLIILKTSSAHYSIYSTFHLLSSTLTSSFVRMTYTSTEFSIPSFECYSATSSLPIISTFVSVPIIPANTDT